MRHEVGSGPAPCRSTVGTAAASASSSRLLCLSACRLRYLLTARSRWRTAGGSALPVGPVMARLVSKQLRSSPPALARTPWGALGGCSPGCARRPGLSRCRRRCALLAPWQGCPPSLLMALRYLEYSALCWKDGWTDSAASQRKRERERHGSWRSAATASSPHRKIQRTAGWWWVWSGGSRCRPRRERAAHDASHNHLALPCNMLTTACTAANSWAVPLLAALTIMAGRRPRDSSTTTAM